MKIIFFTIVYDGMPFLAWIYPELRKLEFDWEWRVMEGVAAPAHCTEWCADIDGGTSHDGTIQYLRDVSEMDRRVSLESRWRWNGKVEMVNHAIDGLNEPCLLWQIDSDEIWTAYQIDLVRELFLTTPNRSHAFFRCNYFVGPDIVITSRDSYGNYSSYEWLRVWRYQPGQTFLSHEPPRLSDAGQSNPFLHDETEAHGLVFDHYAYVTERQLRFKEHYYGSNNNKNGHLYRGAFNNWRRLQCNTKWPVKDLSAFLPWVGPMVTADRVIV